MASFNGRESYAQSLIAGVMRTLESGEAAAVRALSGNAKAGDKKRVESALRVLEQLRDQAGRAEGAAG